MNGRPWAAAIGVLLLSLACAADAPFVSLFDGKSLEGWVPEHTNRFSARNGILAYDGGTGWLRSAKAYKDFEFQAEYRAVTPGADSGIFFRAAPQSTPEEPHWPVRGYQLQVTDGESNLKIFGHGTPPPTFDRKTEALKKVMKGAGQWQRIVLKVVGKHAEVMLDGELIAVTDAIVLPEGHLGLQGEKGQFEWRDLKVRDLTPP
jgi:hypothetical protein